MDVQKAVSELSSLTHKYPLVYRKVEQTLKPGLFEKFVSGFGWIHFRLSRLRRSIDLIESQAEEAFQIIDRILTISSSIRSTLVSKNAEASGRLMRLSNDLEFKHKQIQAMTEACKDTLELIEKYEPYGLLKLPENYLDWIKITFDDVLSLQKITISERTRHQRAWSNLIKLINEEKEIILKQEIENRRYQWTYRYETICENSIQGFQTERDRLEELVDSLKSAITIGEIQEIERFLSDEFQRQIPFEELVVNESDDYKSLGDYQIEVEVKAKED